MSDLITLKVKRSSKWTHLFLGAVEDKKLSWAAKGLHTYLISRPSEWQIRYAELLARSLNGRTSLKNTISLLKSHGYLEIQPTRDANGKFTGSVWIVFETPEIIDPQVRFPSYGKIGQRENRITENTQGTTIHNKYLPIKETTTTRQTSDVVVFSNSEDEYNPEQIIPLLLSYGLSPAVVAARSLVQSRPQLPSSQVWHATWCLAWQVQKKKYEISTSWEDVIEGTVRKGVRHPVGCPIPTEVIEKRRLRDEARKADKMQEGD